MLVRATNYYEYLAMSDEQLRWVDPVEMNLFVAKSIPALGHLDVPRYQQLADEWAEGVRGRLPHAERTFAESPGEWENDVNLIRLSVLCEHLDCEVGLAYNEDQRLITRIRYTNPADLFLNGVMDTLRGTCGNMAMVHVAVAWRLGWPVSLACVNSHHIARYDDGRVQYTVETTYTGRGGFSTPTDDYFIREFRLPPKAISSGSDLRALGPREMLGIFVGLRARHFKDVGDDNEAEKTFLLARHLLPAQRNLYKRSVWNSVMRSQEFFEPNEEGSPQDLIRTLAASLGEPTREGAAVPSNGFRNVIYT